MLIKPLYTSLEDIQNFLYVNQLDRRYENLLINNWLEEVTTNRSTWAETGFAFYSDDGMLVGFINLNIRRPTDILDVAAFLIIDKRYTVSIFRKVEEFIKLRMNKRVPKLCFSTMVGSHAEGVWNKIIAKYNGVLVGVFRNNVIDQSGNYRDMVKYEIHNEEFIG